MNSIHYVQSLDLSILIIDEKLVGQFNTDFLSDFNIGNELSSINIGPSYLNCIYEVICKSYLLILNSILYMPSLIFCCRFQHFTKNNPYSRVQYLLESSGRFSDNLGDEHSSVNFGLPFFKLKLGFAELGCVE